MEKEQKGTKGCGEAGKSPGNGKNIRMAARHTRTTAIIALGAALLTGCASSSGDAGEEPVTKPGTDEVPVLTDSAVIEKMTCELEGEPRIETIRDSRYGPLHEEQILLSIPSHPEEATVDDLQYKLQYTKIDGESLLDELGQYTEYDNRYEIHEDEEYGAYNVGMLPDPRTANIREARIIRSFITPEEGDTGYASVWHAICGSIRFEVQPDQTITNPGLVEDEKTGTIQYAGQLR